MTSRALLFVPAMALGLALCDTLARHRAIDPS